ncbi:hypothetical protein [Aquabacterium sp.]|uniref:hypothetical protein n=1 Tax=Aquabacterium sp. TaxID=1872578 RepID=UPI0019951254|nr:hypothetical protein [Aquabacterium sp.]MBC7702129.1 hypothetical protein [Aquabacterium sp.]
MSISPFFHELRSAYQAELDDLSSDSEGKDVLRQRLAAKRKEVDFLLQMVELCPEMVAVVFHQGFRFPQPVLMDQLLSLEVDEFPEWDTLANAVQLTPWAQELAQVFLKEPSGGRFLTVAAGLEYMHGKVDPSQAAQVADEDTEDGEDRDGALDQEENDEARAREEAGADWMVEQGFDRKE